MSSSMEEKNDGEGEGEYIRVHFRVRCPIRLGQSLAISGSSFSLGNFNASKVFKLYTTPEAYPIWFTNVDTPVLIHKKEILHEEGVRYNYCLLEGGLVKAFERSHADSLTQAQDALVRLLKLGKTAGNDVVIEDESLLHRQHFATEHNSDIDVFEHVRQLSSSQSKQHITIPPSFSTMSLSSNIQQKKKMDTVPLNLFIVCYHLPVTITVNKSDTTGTGEYRPFEITWAESLIAKSENSVASAMQTTWIGTISVGKNITASEKEWLVQALSAMNCIAVFLDADIARDSYKGFCKTVMWPVFHNVDQLDHIHAAWNLHPESGGNVQPIPKEKGTSKDQISGTLNPSSENFKAEANLLNDKVVEWNKMGMQYFQSYKTMNEAFAAALFPHLDNSCENIVWVHDYHLMLLPSALRKPPCEFGGVGTVPIKMKIIFFMHIPFPTSQIFRTAPMSTTFLQSMVCADLVGFHAFDHARHFLNATKRLLGIKSYTRTGGMLTLLVQDREVVVTMNHVSIEPSLIEKALKDPETQRMAAEWKAKYHGKKIIAGVDICQRLSGGALKMAAFDKLLVDYNLGEKGAVVLIQRCIRSGSREQDEQTTSADMRKMVNEINGKFSSKANLGQLDSSSGGGKSLVDYEEVSDMTLNQRVALWLAADVFLLTPIREGLNLMPLEYIYARKDLPSAGAVVVSEFSTCSSLLNGSLKVNPFAALHVADALEKALSMSMKDMNYRRQRDLQFVSSHPSSLWTRNILRDLDLDSSASTLPSSSHLSTNISKSKSIKKYPEPMSVNQVVSAYDNALRTTGLCKTANRVFIFDYGGTLLHKEKYDIEVKKTMSAISGRKPTDKVMEAIRKLSDDPNNVVMVVTGLTKLKMGDTFSDMPNVTLITSIGLVYRWGLNLKSPRNSPAVGTDSGEEKSPSTVGYRAYATKDTPSPQEQAHERWEFLNNKTDWATVSAIAMPIITRFTFRTNGTCQTPRIPGIGWSYFGSDPDWGEKQSSQLKVELEAALAKFDVKVASLIQGSIEVVPSNLHKGIMVEALLKKVLAKRANKLPSFVLIVGDEESDDHMFEAFYNVLGSVSPNSGMDIMRAFTVTVAKRESPAHYYINSVQDVEHLLHVLGNSTFTEAPLLEGMVDEVVVGY